MLIDKESSLKINFDKSLPVVDIKKDLNKLDDDSLNQVKEHMNESFEINHIKPSDSAWKYDVEVDFDNNGKIESSAWDNDDDSDMEF